MTEQQINEYVGSFIEKLKHEYGLNKEDIIRLLTSTETSLQRKEVLIPISIFNNKELTTLEATCKYMKEQLNLNYHQIADLLNRDERAIWKTYHDSKEKRGRNLLLRPTKIFIPASIFRNRLSFFEALVKYLKEKYNLKYSEIAELLSRDERNIWSIYNKAINKLKH